MIRTLPLLLSGVLIATFGYAQATERGFLMGLQHRSILTEGEIDESLYNTIDLFHLQAAYRWNDRWETGVDFNQLELVRDNSVLDLDVYQRAYLGAADRPLRIFLEAQGGIDDQLSAGNPYRAWSAGIGSGLAFRLDRRFSATLGARYLRLWRNYEINREELGTGSGTFFYRSQLGSSQRGQAEVRLGVRYHFGKRL